jgi:hypothetical protein
MQRKVARRRKCKDTRTGLSCRYSETSVPLAVHCRIGIAAFFPLSFRRWQELNLGETQVGIPPEGFRLGNLREFYLGDASFAGELTNDFSFLNGWHDLRDLSRK